MRTRTVLIGWCAVLALAGTPAAQEKKPKPDGPLVVDRDKTVKFDEAGEFEIAKGKKLTVTGVPVTFKVFVQGLGANGSEGELVRKAGGKLSKKSAELDFTVGVGANATTIYLQAGQAAPGPVKGAITQDKENKKVTVELK
jgi:hypothetical protein